MMQKRVITGIIVVFLMLAGQNWAGSRSTGDFGGAPKSPVLEHSESAPSLSNVVRVVDGDTIVVLVDGVAEKVRLIGVNTPETVDPRRPVQCFGKEASAFTKSLLENKTIHLESDASQGDRDKYGRLLRYVLLTDGSLINEKIIAEGYGNEYTYRNPYKYQKEFKKAERDARNSQKGLWAQGICTH